MAIASTTKKILFRGRAPQRKRKKKEQSSTQKRKDNQEWRSTNGSPCQA